MNRPSWKDYFTFSKKERHAVIILVIIIFCAVVLPFFISKQEAKLVVDKQLEQQIAQLKSNDKIIDTSANEDEISNVSFQSNALNVAEHKASQLFYFDPNTLNAEGWGKLGLKEKTIQTILNFRSKGGKFKQAEDIRKIYGLKKEDADKLIPYIQIPSDNIVASRREKQTSSIDSNPSIKKQNFVSATKKIESIDINTATAEQWKSLPLIGDVLSNRIVKFRNKLGGFTTIDQVKQTYGLSDSTFQIIKPYLTISNPIQ